MVKQMLVKTQRRRPQTAVIANNGAHKLWSRQIVVKINGGPNNRWSRETVVKTTPPRTRTIRLSAVHSHDHGCLSTQPTALGPPGALADTATAGPTAETAHRVDVVTKWQNCGSNVSDWFVMNSKGRLSYTGWTCPGIAHCARQSKAIKTTLCVDNMIKTNVRCPK